MKVLFVIYIFSTSVFAYTDFVCRINSDNVLEVMNTNGNFAVAELTNSMSLNYVLNVSKQKNKMVFRGRHSFKLDISTWPDSKPVYGKSYRSRFNVNDLSDNKIYNISCIYRGR